MNHKRLNLLLRNPTNVFDLTRENLGQVADEIEWMFNGRGVNIYSLTDDLWTMNNPKPLDYSGRLVRTFEDVMLPSNIHEGMDEAHAKDGYIRIRFRESNCDICVIDRVKFCIDPDSGLYLNLGMDQRRPYHARAERFLEVVR